MKLFCFNIIELKFQMEISKHIPAVGIEPIHCDSPVRRALDKLRGALRIIDERRGIIERMLAKIDNMLANDVAEGEILEDLDKKNRRIRLGRFGQSVLKGHGHC